MQTSDRTDAQEHLKRRTLYKTAAQEHMRTLTFCRTNVLLCHHKETKPSENRRKRTERNMGGIGARSGSGLKHT